MQERGKVCFCLLLMGNVGCVLRRFACQRQHWLFKCRWISWRTAVLYLVNKVLVVGQRVGIQGFGRQGLLGWWRYHGDRVI